MVAQEHKFKRIHVETTSPGTKPICEKLEYNLIGMMRFSDFKSKNNTNPYTVIDDYIGPHLFCKNLD